MTLSRAALALVGWYLLTPPIVHDQSGVVIVDTSAPLPKWSVVSSYDTKKECSVARAALPSVVLNRDLEDEELRLMPYDQRQQAIHIAKTMTGKAVCVDEGDPRLTPN